MLDKNMYKTIEPMRIHRIIAKSCLTAHQHYRNKQESEKEKEELFKAILLILIRIDQINAIESHRQHHAK